MDLDYEFGDRAEPETARPAAVARRFSGTGAGPTLALVEQTPRRPALTRGVLGVHVCRHMSTWPSRCVSFDAALASDYRVTFARPGSPPRRYAPRAR